MLKTSQKLLLLFVFILGAVITVLLVRQQQELRQRATLTEVSVTAACSANNTVDLNLSFTNTSVDIVNVIAKDTQTGKEAALGTANPGDTVTGTINTDLQTVSQSTVLFETSNGDTKVADYTSLDCSGTVRTCGVNEAQCTWDALDNTTQYKVTITDTDSGTVIKDGIVNHPTTGFTFPAEPGGKYTCEVIPVNSCGEGDKSTGEGTCPLPTPTSVPTATPEPSATLTPEPSVSVTPTTVQSSSTPIPTNTPVPTNTTIPTNTPVLTNPPGNTVTQNSPTPTKTVINNSPTPTTQAVGGGNNATLSATPTAIKELPPTGLSQDMLTITFIGSMIVLLGAFVLIFLW